MLLDRAVGLARVARIRRARALRTQFGQSLLDLRQLRLDVVDQRLVEDIGVEAVVVEPEGVSALRRLEQPVDWGLAAALGVTADVIGPEAACARLSEIVAHVPDAEVLARLALDRL